MDGTVPTDRFSAGQEQAECGKAASRQGKLHPDWRESAAFFANLPANRGFGRGRCDMAAFGGRFVLHVLAQTLWSIARLFCAKRPSERAKSCVFSTIICKGRLSVSPVRVCGRSRNLFCGVRPMVCILLRKAALLALPPPAFPRSVSILSCPSVLCLRTSDLSGLECFLPPFRAARSAYVQVPPESVWSKGKALFAGRAFFSMPRSLKTKISAFGYARSSGNGWR